MEGIYFGEAEDFANFIREKDSISVNLLSGDQQIQGTRESSDYYSELLLILPPVL